MVNADVQRSVVVDEVKNIEIEKERDVAVETAAVAETVPVGTECVEGMAKSEGGVSVEDDGVDWEGLLAGLLETMKQRGGVEKAVEDVVKMELKLNEPESLFEMIETADRAGAMIESQVANMQGDETRVLRLTKLSGEIRDSVRECLEKNAHLKQAMDQWASEKAERMNRAFESLKITFDTADLFNTEQQTQVETQAGTDRTETETDITQIEQAPVA